MKRWDRHQGVVLDTVRGFDVIDCEACGFRHIVPIPAPGELEAVYRDEYYSVEKPRYLERQQEDLDWWRLVYADRYDTFEALLPVSRRRILDVGCGPGFFLLHGQQRGWQTLGLEPSAQAARHARGLGLEILQEFLTRHTAERIGMFDGVHLSEVLEHVPDPAGLLRLVRDLLTPGGLVCVVVPNDYNSFQKAVRTGAGCAAWWVAPPHHINYFDFESLERLLRSCGFEITLREATFPIDLFLLMGDNYVGNDALGRLCHDRRKRFERALEDAGLGGLKRNLYRALARQGVGREAVLFGRVAAR